METDLLTCRFTFECRLECDTSSPKIEWYKDSMLINTPDYQTSYKDGLCMLTIEETFSEDSAKWMCKAITENGTAETSCTLKVKGIDSNNVLTGGGNNIVICYIYLFF